MTVDEMIRLTREMGGLGVLAFEAGDFKVSFGQPAALPVPVEKLESMGDEEEDLFFSSPVRPRSE